MSVSLGILCDMLLGYMSLDVFLQKFISGEPAEVRRESVRAVLMASSHSGPDEHGYFIVTFPDGVDVELSAKGLDGSGSFTGCAFHVRGLSSNLAAFIFEIAKAGDMVVLPAMEDFVPILSAPEQRNELPPDLQAGERGPVLCRSASELEVLLSGGYVAWQKYLNQVSKPHHPGVQSPE
ncbi:MAG TPA: hypothetical protein VN087_23090 [Verrucomicrobiae bacterium]|nr:hypothetical protein [Verrucomicrobiae bacterium]